MLVGRDIIVPIIQLGKVILMKKFIVISTICNIDISLAIGFEFWFENTITDRFNNAINDTASF